MIPSKRLTLVFIGLMLIPLVSVGFIMLTTAWIYTTPEQWGSIFAHWIALLLIAIIVMGCLVVAFVLSHNITEQITLITHAVRTMDIGKEIHHIDLHHLYQEFHLLYNYIKHHTDFHREMTRTLADIVRNVEQSKTLELRSEDDEFVKLVNTLITRLQRVSEITAAMAEGNLATVKPLNEFDTGLEKEMYVVISELGNLILKARNYTNQMVRAGSQINSITTQGLQDTQVVTKRTDEISQSIHQMATNIQHVAEHLQEQSSLLGDTSSSIDQTMRSIETIANNITHLKSIIEKSTPSAHASEATSPSLDLLSTATKSIEDDAHTCVRCSQEAAADAEQGKIAVQETMTGMNRIQESMDELFGVIRRLRERAEEVSETLNVISDIADHTNLLAINAAIISAHAGEHGRDFAVIADEIGKFAERTRESTSEIEELLKAIQSEFSEASRAMNKSSKAVSQGVELSHQAGKTLGKIASSIFNTQDIVTRIASATTDQSRENDRIRDILQEFARSQKENQEQVSTILWQLMEAIAQIRGITSEQAEGSAQIAETAQNLDQITREISQATSQHVITAHQISDAVNYIRKLVQRTTLGTEKTTQLTDELFTLGGNLALTMGEFLLVNRTLPPEMTTETRVIGFVKRSSESFFDYMATGIRTEAAQYGYQILEIDSHYEVTTQVEGVNWLLKQPVLKGMIVCAVDPSVAQKLVQKGIERGIPCVAADESVTATISVRSGNREGGQRAAEIFSGHLQSNAVIGVCVDRTARSIVRRFEGFRQRAAQYPFEIVEIYCDVTDPQKAGESILSGIKDNPGLQGLFLTNELTTQAYLHLLHQGLLPASDLLAVGYDYTPMTVKAIQKGELLGAIFQKPKEIGRQAFQYLYRLIKQEIRIEDFDERTIYIPTVKVTIDTLSEAIQ